MSIVKPHIKRLIILELVKSQEKLPMGIRRGLAGAPDFPCDVLSPNASVTKLAIHFIFYF